MSCPVGYETMYIDEEDPKKLKALGLKIKAAKELRTEIIGFFVKDERASYGTDEECQFLIDMVNLYICGSTVDAMADAMQVEREPVMKFFDLMGLDWNEKEAMSKIE